MELKEIKELIALMRKNDLSEFRLEQEGFKITLKRGPEGVQVISPAGGQPVSYMLPQAGGGPAPGNGNGGTEKPAAATAPSEALRDIVSPMVGTFYTAATPESGPYISVGQQVTEETVVCIIEAMKVMNEIKAEAKGVIAEIVAENGKPVQYGQALFRLR